MLAKLAPLLAPPLQRLFLVLDSTLQAYSAMQGAAVERLGTAKETVLPNKVRLMMELRDDLMRRYL